MKTSGDAVNLSLRPSSENTFLLGMGEESPQACWGMLYFTPYSKLRLLP
ncbi:MAG: hypothetical protein QXI39_08900 [Candidatus Bathyarchaeia archaeon]